MVGSLTNKKVRNATKCEYNGIKFRSKLELFTYKELLKLKVPIRYEQDKFILLPKFSNSVHLYISDRNKNLTEKECKFLAMTYTPDFTFIIKNHFIIVEDKGRENDSYPLKKKLFLESIARNTRLQNYEIHFFEPRNQRQVLQCISIIKSL